MKNGIPVSDMTMEGIRDVCEYLDLDFRSYFGDYVSLHEGNVFRGNYLMGQFSKRIASKGEM